MNSVGLDTFLKPAPLPAKSSGTGPAHGSTSEFGGYLREAAATTRETIGEQPPNTAQRAERPAVAAQQEQGSNKNPEEQSAEVVELGARVAEEPSEEIEQDEVIITAMAVATADQAPGQAVVLSDSEPVAAAQPTAEASPTIMPADQPEEEFATSDIAEETITRPTSGEGAEPIDAMPAATVLPPETTPATVATTVATVSQETIEPAVQPIAGRKNPAANDIVDAPNGAPITALEILENNIEGEPLIDLTAKPGSDTPTSTLTSHGPQSSPPTSSDTGPTSSGAALARDEPSGQMPMVDRARFVQRVTNAFRSAQQNDGHIQLRLSPPELGSLRIEIAVRNGVLSANLETETAEARRLVLDNLPALRQRLAEQDIRIEKFDVDVRREGSQSDGQAGAEDRQAQQQSQRATAHNRIRTHQAADVVAARVARPPGAPSNSGLDVRI